MGSGSSQGPSTVLGQLYVLVLGPFIVFLKNGFYIVSQVYKLEIILVNNLPTSSSYFFNINAVFSKA